MATIELTVQGQFEVVNLEPTEKMVAVLNRSRYEWLQTGSIGVRLVDDEAIRALNRDYGGEDKATDVLSFDYSEAGFALPGGEGELGDVIVSVETAERQAEEAGTKASEEVALLVLHGILHIHGFDHANEAGQQFLQDIQLTILNAAGVTYRKFKWE